ncbi:MAG TPA: adenylate/guanylate cyclase domain-containing protein [Verrucomicrobiae bacterium]|jgi:adenylate cyclase|nr:adenylate/guanylate cyclase domain-containing protein [Verrucomicrobiae bacterium]
MPRFVISRPNEESRVFELSGDRPISIGRAKSSSLMLDDSNISRLHAAVLKTPGGEWQIVDRGSVNGIVVNGVRVREATLHPNDEIVLGEHRLRFEESEVAGFVVHDTTRLPDRLVQEMRRSPSPYSGSFLPVIPVANPAEAKPSRRKESTDRERELQRENSLLTLLLRVNRALGELQNVNVVAERVLDLVLEIEGAERGYAMLLDESCMGARDFSRGDYSFQPAMLRTRSGLKRPDGQPQPKLIISQTIIRKVMESGLPLLLADAQAPEGSIPMSRSMVSSGVLSAMCAPLGTRDRSFGLLYVDSPTRRSLFTQEALDIFAVIAAQAGLAIDRVRTQEEIARQNLKLGALERFLSPDVAGKVIADAADLRLGGRKQTATLLFADIRSFTTMAENTTPEHLVEILNGFFQQMTDVIFQNEGTLDKFLGDGMMCLFGAPFSHWDDALGAVNAAAEMQAALAEFNRTGNHAPLRMGIGIHTGEVIIGYMGSARRMDYTAIGDTVNVAARLTSEAEPDQILVSAATWNAIREKVPARALDARKLKGRGEPIEVLEILWKELLAARSHAPATALKEG